MIMTPLRHDTRPCESREDFGMRGGGRGIKNRARRYRRHCGCTGEDVEDKETGLDTSVTPEGQGDQLDSMGNG